ASGPGALEERGAVVAQAPRDGDGTAERIGDGRLAALAPRREQRFDGALAAVGERQLAAARVRRPFAQPGGDRRRGRARAQAPFDRARCDQDPHGGPWRLGSSTRPVMSRAPRSYVMYAQAHSMSTSTRLRKPMRKKMWMSSHASHAKKPEM